MSGGPDLALLQLLGHRGARGAAVVGLWLARRGKGHVCCCRHRRVLGGMACTSSKGSSSSTVPYDGVPCLPLKWSGYGTSASDIHSALPLHHPAQIATMLLYLTDVEEGVRPPSSWKEKDGLDRLRNIDYTKCDTGIQVSVWGTEGGTWSFESDGVEKRSLCPHGLVEALCSALIIVHTPCTAEGCGQSRSNSAPLPSAIQPADPCRPPPWLPPQVKPRKGDALLFWNINPDGSLDQHALHGGCDVVSGQKWAATKWMRNKCIGMDCPKSRTNAQ